MTLLQLRRVSQRFGGVDALKDVSFEIGPAEMVGLIGPNGSGKSTLINTVSGVLHATHGTVLLRGIDITRKRTPAIFRLGIVRNFQSPRLYWELPIRRNIEIAALEAKGKDALMHRFIAEHLPDLLAKADRQARSLTLFEQKKLEIALRLSSGPSLLLLDEPAAGLSPSEQDELVGILIGLNQRGCALLVIEHSMSVIFRTCTRVLVLRGGVLIANGPPAALVNDEAVIEAYLGPGAAALLK